MVGAKDLKWHEQDGVRFAYNPATHEFFTVRADDDGKFAWDIFSVHPDEADEFGRAESVENALLLVDDRDGAKVSAEWDAHVNNVEKAHFASADYGNDDDSVPFDDEPDAEDEIYAFIVEEDPDLDENGAEIIDDDDEPDFEDDDPFDFEDGYEID